MGIMKWLGLEFDNSSDKKRLENLYKEYQESTYLKANSDIDCPEGYACVGGYCIPTTTTGGLQTGTQTYIGTGGKIGYNFPPASTNSPYNVGILGGRRIGKSNLGTWTPYGGAGKDFSKEFKFNIACPEQFIRDGELGAVSYEGGLGSFSDVYDLINDQMEAKRGEYNQWINEKDNGIPRYGYPPFFRIYLGFEDMEMVVQLDMHGWGSKEEAVEYLTTLSKEYKKAAGAVDLSQFPEKMREVLSQYRASIINVAVGSASKEFCMKYTHLTNEPNQVLLDGLRYQDLTSDNITWTIPSTYTDTYTVTCDPTAVLGSGYSYGITVNIDDPIAWTPPPTFK